ncbi:hypothetical protein BH10BAC3_BH10BAC3_14470 [soil metagenome]
MRQLKIVSRKFTIDLKINFWYVGLQSHRVVRFIEYKHPLYHTYGIKYHHNMKRKYQDVINTEKDNPATYVEFGKA